jgi:hypothetical protein
MKDTYLKIYDCLLKYHVLDEKEDCKTFAYNLKHGDLSAEYKDDVKIYLRKLCAMILPNIKETEERKKWKHKIAVSFKLKNDDYITKYNTGVSLQHFICHNFENKNVCAPFLFLLNCHSCHIVLP